MEIERHAVYRVPRRERRDTERSTPCVPTDAFGVVARFVVDADGEIVETRPSQVEAGCEP